MTQRPVRDVPERNMRGTEGEESKSPALVLVLSSYSLPGEDLPSCVAYHDSLAGLG
jgi:hypothetical protein